MPAPAVSERVLVWISGLVLAAALAFHAGALARRTGPPTDDEARHLVLAAAVRDLPQRPPREWVNSLYQAAGAQPPAHHVLVAAGFLVFGESARVAWGLQLVLLFATTLAVWRFAHRLLGPAAGALAALVFATLPGVTRLARTARPEMTTALLVALVLVMLSMLRPQRGATVVLGVLLGIGAMSLWSFPLFVAGPLLVAAFPPAAGEGWSRRRLAAAAALGLLIAAPWWIDFLQRLPPQGVWVGLAAVPPERLPTPASPFWARAIVDHHLSGPLRLVFLAGCLVIAWRLLPRRTGRAAALGLITGVALPCVILTSIGAVDAESLLPALPMLAALLAWTVASLPAAWARSVVAAGLAAYAVVAWVLALGAPAFAARARQAARSFPLLYAALDTDTAEMGPRPDLLDWPAERVIDEIEAGVSPLAPRASLLLVPNYTTLNPMTLTWLARRRGFRLAAVSLPRDGPPPPAEALDFVLVNVKGSQDPVHVTKRQARATARLLRRRGLVAVTDLPSPVGPLTLLRSRRELLPPSPLPAGTHFDLTRSAVRWHLAEGWSEPEPNGTWALGAGARFRVQLQRGTRYLLVAELEPYPQLDRPQVIEVRYGSSVIAVWRPLGGWRTCTAEIPAGLPTGGVDDVRFTFAAAARVGNPESDTDSRWLAVFFRSIRFE